MNGFSYIENKKEIQIIDGKTMITWKYVDKDIAETAAKMFYESKSIDDYLIQQNCKRFWGSIV